MPGGVPCARFTRNDGQILPGRTGYVDCCANPTNGAALPLRRCLGERYGMAAQLEDLTVVCSQPPTSSFCLMASICLAEPHGSAHSNSYKITASDHLRVAPPDHWAEKTFDQSQPPDFARVPRMISSPRIVD